MDEQIRQIADRLKGLRDALELKAEEVAKDCGLTVEEYNSMEAGECDMSISILQRIAHRYGVTLDELMFGEEPKMNSYFLTRKGAGVSVERVKAYKYELLASGFKGRIADPFIVTIEPKPGEILMSPTHFVVQTCSKELATVNLAGDVDFAVQDSLKSNRLTVNMAGKCLISAQALDIHHLELNLAGKCETDLHGKAENVELNLAGKCDYEALSLETGSLKCNTAGSCSLQVFVNDRIELHPVGICNLSYKGNPQIVQEGVNVGNIKQITE